MADESGRLGLDSNKRPVISFTLYAYNQERIIHQAVKGAFSQTYSPLEIILSDDCSSDRTFEIMEKMAAAYHGPHKVVLNRNLKNLGMGRHYSKIMEMANGEIIVGAAGDDVSLPERTLMSWEILHDNPEVTSVSLGLLKFAGIVPVLRHQETGQKPILRFYDLSDYISNVNFPRPNAQARAFRKSAHDFFGPLNEDCAYEDGPNFMRCLLLGKGATCERLAVLVRLHDVNPYAWEHKYSRKYRQGYANYCDDIEKARKSGRIDDKTAEKCMFIIQQRVHREDIKRDFYESSHKLSFFLDHILFSKLFPSQTKLNLAKRALVGDGIGELIYLAFRRLKRYLG